MLNSVIRYFDLQSSTRSTVPKGQASGVYAPVLPQYLATCAGVIAEPFLRTYITSGEWGMEQSALWGRVIFGLIIGVILLPAVYKSAFDPSKPIAVQLAAMFPMGVGWQSLVASSAKAILPA